MTITVDTTAAKQHFAEGVKSTKNFVEGAVPKVERICANTMESVTRFLDTHPGISMILSPTTVTRRCAQKHVDTILNR